MEDINRMGEEEYLIHLARQPWPWFVPVGRIKTLSKDQFETRLKSFYMTAKSVTKSPMVETVCEVLPVHQDRLRQGLARIFHLDMGAKKVYCLSEEIQGIRKKKSIYREVAHHRGHCPFCKNVTLKKRHE